MTARQGIPIIEGLELTAGISRQSAQKAFLRALHRNTAADIQTHHRSELAELDAQQAKLWTVVDNPKVSEKNLIAAIRSENHSRRADQTGRAGCRPNESI